MFENLKTGDRVVLVPRGSAGREVYPVVKVTPKRFRARIGYNDATHQDAFQTYRRSDGRSVGSPHCITFVKPLT